MCWSMEYQPKIAKKTEQYEDKMKLIHPSFKIFRLSVYCDPLEMFGTRFDAESSQMLASENNFSLNCLSIFSLYSYAHRFRA